MKWLNVFLKNVLFISTYLTALVSPIATLRLLHYCKVIKPKAPFIKFLILLYIPGETGVASSKDQWSAFLAYMFSSGTVSNIKVDFTGLKYLKNPLIVNDILDSLSMSSSRFMTKSWPELYKDDPVQYEEILSFLGQNKEFIIRSLHPVGIKKVAQKFNEIFSAEVFEFHDPKVYGKEECPQRRVDVAPQYTALIHDVTLTGAFQIIKNDSLIIYDETAVPNGNIVAGVWRYFLSVGPDMVLYFQKKGPRTSYENGILISGRATENYYHWLIEYLPRVFNILSDPSLDPKTPLIVKSGLHKQFYEALEILCPGSPLLLVDPDQGPIEFKSMIVPSMHSYLPDDFFIPYWKGGAVSVKHLQFLRNTVLEKSGRGTSGREKRIYLKRSGLRSIENNDEIEELMVEKGFKIIRPELLSFVEQVRLFNNSEIIVGAGGAAMANLIFTDPKTKVICFVSNRNSEFCTQSNLAQITGASYIHVTGPNTKDRSEFDSEDEFVHSSYSVNLEDLRKALSEIGV